MLGKRGCNVGLACCVWQFSVYEAPLALWHRQLSLCGTPPQEIVCTAPLIFDWVVRRIRAPRGMSNHGLFVDVSALALV
jgi:hypothetical protein